MIAFALAVPAALPSSCGRARCAAPRARWRCGADENGAPMEPAIAAGAEVRARLQRLKQEREERNARTQRALEEMKQQIAELVAKVRAHAGMPPLEREKPAPAAAAAAAPPPGPPAEGREPAMRRREAAGPAAGKKNSATLRVGVDGATGTGAGGGEDAEGDEPYMDPKNFGYESTAGWQVLASGDDLPESDSDGKVQFRIECDMNGCSLIVQPQGVEPSGPGVRQQFVQSGPGFRIGYDPDSPKSFCGMVGNDQWLLALSRDETRHFKRLMLALRNKMKRIAQGKEDPPARKPAVRRGGDGMFNERVGRTGGDLSVELESKLLWVQAFGQPESYGVRAIFMESRQSEGYWPPPVVPGMISATEELEID